MTVKTNGNTNTWKILGIIILVGLLLVIFFFLKKDGKKEGLSTKQKALSSYIPAIIEVKIDPEAPTAGDFIRALPVLKAPGMKHMTFQYQWFVNGDEAPGENKKLLATITTSLQLKKSKGELNEIKAKQKHKISGSELSDNRMLVGNSPAIAKVMNTVEKVAITDANVLILGENGTGKELIARAIHDRSKHKDEVFISVDLGAITETLFESELFGFKKGAFTDAKEDRAGRFEAANKGTIFLDEIGNLSLSLQSKLLSVLQNRTVVRLGTNREIPIDVRLICATNMPLYQMVNESKFRQDLLYRINTVEINIPPLREREEDINMLLDHFLNIYCQKYKIAQKRVSPAALKRLEKHPWPGNIRELQHAVERAVIMSESNILQPDDFFLSKSDEAVDETIKTSNLNLEETEKMLIRKVIDKHGGNISKAAKELGLTRASLYRRIEKYGL